MHAPFTAWHLAAHSAPELHAWLAAFGRVLGEAKVALPGAATATLPSAPVHADAYPAAGRAATSPVHMNAEEVM